MNSSVCTLILLDVQLYKYLDFLHVKQKNDIPSAFLFYLRISAAHKLPTRMSYQLLQPASTHVGSIYPRLVGMRVQKGHLYSGTVCRRYGRTVAADTTPDDRWPGRY